MARIEKKQRCVNLTRLNLGDVEGCGGDGIGHAPRVNLGFSSLHVNWFARILNGGGNLLGSVRGAGALLVRPGEPVLAIVAAFRVRCSLHPKGRVLPSPAGTQLLPKAWCE